MTFKRLFFTCLLVVTSSVSFAYDFSAVAPSGQTLYYNIVDGHAEVVRPGTGSTFNNYVVGDLIIPDSVIYNGNTYAVTVLAKIDTWGSFERCSGLTSVTIPNSVTSIGNNTFSYCSGLTSVIIPNTVTSIGSSAFEECSGLTSVTFPNSIITIDQRVFKGCRSLTSVIIPNSVASIGREAFYGCSALTSVIIPNSVISIGSYAFWDCISIPSVTIPNSVLSIGGSAFSYVRHIDYYGTATGAPWGAYSMNGVTDGDFVYSNNTRDTLIAYIGGDNDVAIPGTISVIDDNAFRNCDNLTSVIIPNSVASIGREAFYGCNNLVTVYMKSMIAPTIGSICFSGNRSGRVFFIPCGSYNSYYNASSWLSYSSDLREEIGFTFNIQSAENTTGTVSIITEPTCQSKVATFMGIANNGYYFSHWSDNNTDNPRMLALIKDTSITAFFEPNAELYTVVANNAMGGGVYESGSTATLFALPQVDLQFAGWSDNMTTNPRHIVVTSDTMLTALYRAPDTLRIYDTTTVYDTVINMVYDTTEYNHYYYDTTEYNHYYYDTTRIYDTLVVFDTTRVFDTMVYISIDTLHHYYYDTTRIYDTMVVFDTTRVFDTMVYINTDTLHHYYYDTTRVYDTLVVFDTTRVFDTMVYVNIDTLHHYYYDTTRIYDTVVFLNVDTLNHYYYDTTSVTHYIFDSTWVFDSVWIFDSVYIFDTIYIHDTIVVGVDEVDVINAKIYTSHGQIVVNGAESNTVWLYDVNGRILATKQDEYTPLHFDVPASGAYLIKIGNHPARRVVVIR